MNPEKPYGVHSHQHLCTVSNYMALYSYPCQPLNNGCKEFHVYIQEMKFTCFGTKDVCMPDPTPVPYCSLAVPYAVGHSLERVEGKARQCLKEKHWSYMYLGRAQTHNHQVQCSTN